jgi:hypothetical protein
MCIGYAAAGTSTILPFSKALAGATARAMTPAQQEQAKAYARKNGIRWRIVEGK